MINIKERIEIVLDKTVNQIGLLAEDRSNAVVIGYEYDEFGGVVNPDNQLILEWNLTDTQPTIEQLEAITQEQVDNYINNIKTKDDLFRACLSYLKETDFKYNLDYIRRKEEDLSITAVRTECSIYCGSYYDGTVTAPQDAIDKIKTAMNPDDKYLKIFGELLK